jgi:hypothetical protein
VALNDSGILCGTFETQTIEDTPVAVLRLPTLMSWADRVVAARKWIDDFNAEWVSLQFVPFGFHPKGLTFGLSSHVTSIVGSRSLHCMVHELWVLWGFPLPFAKRMLGQWQKPLLRSFFRRIKPKDITTQIPLYQVEMHKIGITAGMLPLHGNIPIHNNGDACGWLADRMGSSNCLNYVKAGFFGGILPTLDFQFLASRTSEFTGPKNKLLLLSAGKLGQQGLNLWQALQKHLKNSAEFFVIGELDEHEASQYFSSLDYGFTSYPVQLMGKSGSVAAMLEHGLRVISCGRSLDRIANTNGEHYKSKPWTVSQTSTLMLTRLEAIRT